MPQSLIILRSHEWRFNPLQCFLDDISLFMVLIVDLFSRVLGFSPRTRSLFTEVLYQQYDKFGIWTGQRKYWPTLYDLVEALRRRDDVNAAAKDALLNRLITLLLTLKPERVAYRSGWNPADLARHSIDFEMQADGEVVKHLFLGCLLATVFRQKVERGVANGELSLLVALDDAQKIVSTEADHDNNNTAPLVELASVGRSPGIGLWVDVQSLQGFSARLMPNLTNRFCGWLGSGIDYSAVASHLSLTAEQVDYANHSFKPGMFIGQTLGGGTRIPYLFTCPEIPPLPSVSDAEAVASCEPLRQLPVERAHEFDRWEPFSSVAVKTQDKTPSPPMLDELEMRYLRHVVQNPGKTSSVYARSAGINGQRAAKIRAKLVDCGFIREHSVATNARGRTSICIEPLAPAIEAVRANPEDKP